jgi:uncharacterized YigZ family protein
MLESQKILVVEQNSTNKVKIKGSQFIGFSFRISNPEDAEKHLNDLKKEFYDASHHCYAYKTKSGDEKYSDDGEPNGTAGIRILNAISHFSITDILVVVVRYFGGTKLGVGPLGKAYGETALNLLENSKLLELTKFEQIKIVYPYEETSAIHYLLNKYDCQKIENHFETKPIINCLVESPLIEKMENELIDKTAGKVQLEALNKVFYLRLK